MKKNGIIIHEIPVWSPIQMPRRQQRKIGTIILIPNWNTRTSASITCLVSFLMAIHTHTLYTNRHKYAQNSYNHFFLYHFQRFCPQIHEIPFVFSLLFIHNFPIVYEKTQNTLLVYLTTKRVFPSKYILCNYKNYIRGIIRICEHIATS